MRIKKFIALFIVLSSINVAQAQDKKFKVQTIAFYNFENLFDTINNANVNDEEYTPTGTQNWTGEKYKKKLANLSRVLNEIGTSDQQKESPVIIGGSEIENRGVLEDLIKQPLLINKDYGIVHYDSPDKRGIDVALLYQKKHFKPTSSVNVPLIIYDQTDKTKRIYTRDQLLVTGLLDGEEMHFIVNHWPSRSGGEQKSSPNREAAGRLNRKIIDSLYNINPNAKIITMGDLNDGPYNKSVKVELGAKAKKEETKERGMYNPMEEMANKGIGTLAYRDAWDLFDQMILSEPLIRKDYTSYRFWKAGVYNKPFLTQTTGQYKGYPLRNSNGQVGFSDHFPVYLYLIKEVK
ncbi:endonuclease/exonuclease/phosphatase family protein [Flavobacterium microcysteis]|uniref:Endonuclease/exonuclease/phosphatase family protein n=1 Tax=Flavobacterium microcysteis TaxID=2596891 RepID=A0A501QG76_9FLAO|nr:endonuclease/exonuclease/phosphatase family protein [Flavobacterium microcysteis]TPD71870.1 endonuclease/exonuclease/phosphatase family protein [Flavobacterium microcysteis]